MKDLLLNSLVCYLGLWNCWI